MGIQSRLGLLASFVIGVSIVCGCRSSAPYYTSVPVQVYESAVSEIRTRLASTPNAAVPSQYLDWRDYDMTAWSAGESWFVTFRFRGDVHKGLVGRQDPPLRVLGFPFTFVVVVDKHFSAQTLKPSEP